jgi:hypothetical protein
MDVRLSSISRKTIAQTLDGLSPVLLVPLMSNFSQAISSGMSSSRAFAAALQAASAQRLCELQAAAPRVRSALDKLTSRLPRVRLNVEEIAIIRAVIGFYIGMVLQWLTDEHRRHRPGRAAHPFTRRRDLVPHFLFISVRRAHRTRIGVFLPSRLIVL